MANFSYLDTILDCLYCFEPFSYSVPFQWGFSTWQYYDEAFAYRIGDAIVWKSLVDGTIPAWTYFVNDDNLSTANYGDANYQNLIIADHYFHGESNNSLSPWICPFCHNPLWCTAIEIKNNILIRAWIFEPEEFAEECDYYVVEADGSILPMPQWQYIPMPIIHS